MPIKRAKFDLILTADPTVNDDDSQGNRVGYRAINTTTGVGWTLIDATPGAAVWIPESAPFVSQAEAEAGTLTEPRQWSPERIAQAIAALAAGNPDYISLRDNAGGQAFTGGFGDFAWDTEDESTPNITFSGPEVTVSVDGIAVVAFSITLDVSANNGRSEWETRLLRDQGSGYAEELGFLGYVYSRNSSQGKGTLTKLKLVNLTSGDKLKVQVAPLSGPNDYESVANGSTFAIFTLKGQKGDKGDPGDPGAGSNVVVKQDNVLVPNTPHGTLNFEGAVEVEDEGSSQVRINVIGGVQKNADETETTRTSLTFTQKLRLTFTVPTGVTVNTYRIDWQCQVRSDDGDVPTRVRVELDDDTVDRIADVGMDSEQKQKLFDSQLSGHRYYDNLTPGSHTVDVDFASGESGKTVRINRVRISAERKA